MSVSCPDHPNAYLIEDLTAGDLICPECGLVIGDRMAVTIRVHRDRQLDMDTEWRSFNNEASSSDPSRVGAPENPLLLDCTSTSIAVGSGVSDIELEKSQRWRIVYAKNKQMAEALGAIHEMADRIDLPKSVQDMAAKIFKDMLDSGTLKGRKLEARSAACLYVACQKGRVPRSIKEICAVSRAAKKKITRCIWLVKSSPEVSFDQVDSADFMPRFCGNLGLPMRVENAATRIARQSLELNLTGRHPLSIAAAAIYMASQASSTKITAKKVSEIVGVARVTVKNTYKEMLPSAAALFPDDFQFDTPIANLPFS